MMQVQVEDIPRNLLLMRNNVWFTKTLRLIFNNTTKHSLKYHKIQNILIDTCR